MFLLITKLISQSCPLNSSPSFIFCTMKADYFHCLFIHSDFLDSCRANTLLAELDDEEDLPEPDDDDDENEDDNQEEQEYEEVLVRSRVNLGYHVHIHRVKPVVVSIIVVEILYFWFSSCSPLWLLEIWCF